MIWTIAKKTFLENVLSRKFLVAFVLAVLILGTGTFAMSKAYGEKQDRYETKLADLEQELEEEGKWGYWGIAELEIFRELGKPDPLSTLISGQGTVPTGMGTVGYMIGEAMGGEESTSPLWNRFGMLDLTFIVGFLMSLMAVIFSYDSISGEKEHGTLKLTLTNDVPKDHVLLGKYIGGTASVLLPFLLAMLLALGIVAVAVGVPFSAADYQAIGLLMFIGCATISAFYLLGMLISSLTKRASVSLIMLLFVWIFLAQGIGNVAALTATGTSGGMSYDEFHDQYMSIWEEVWEEYEPQQENLREQLSQAWEDNNMELVNQLQEEMDALWGEQQEETQRRQEALEEEFRRQQEGQLRTALNVARISPGESYRNVGRALAGLSWDEGVHIQEQMSDYLDALEDEYREWQEEQEEEEHYHIVMAGEEETIETQRRIEIPKENFEPETRLDWYYEPWGASERMGSVTYDLVAIIMTNILLFMGAYVAFLRYDVR